MDSPDKALLCTHSTENMLEKQDGKLGPLGGGGRDVCEQTVKNYILYMTPRVWNQTNPQTGSLGVGMLRTNRG
jgi:hypothetical protein